MEHKQFQNWASGVDALSQGQKQQSQGLLSGVSDENASLMAIKARLAETRQCPHCNTAGTAPLVQDIPRIGGRQMRFHKLLCAASLLLAPSTALAHPDPAQFAPTAFTQEPTLVDCTLEDGTQTRCYEFTARYRPEGLEIGPFCPSNID